MKIKIFLICMLLTLAGCATSKTMYLPDGSIGYNIQCNGTMISISECFQKAGELCGAKGYAILNREGEITSTGYSSGSISANSTSAQGAYITQTGNIVFRSLFIKCNN